MELGKHRTTSLEKLIKAETGHNIYFKHNLMSKNCVSGQFQSVDLWKCAQFVTLKMGKPTGQGHWRISATDKNPDYVWNQLLLSKQKNKQDSTLVKNK